MRNFSICDMADYVEDFEGVVKGQLFKELEEGGLVLRVVSIRELEGIARFTINNKGEPATLQNTSSSLRQNPFRLRAATSYILETNVRLKNKDLLTDHSFFVESYRSSISRCGFQPSSVLIDDQTGRIDVLVHTMSVRFEIAHSFPFGLLYVCALSGKDSEPLLSEAIDSERAAKTALLISMKKEELLDRALIIYEEEVKIGTFTLKVDTIKKMKKDELVEYIVNRTSFKEANKGKK